MAKFRVIAGTHRHEDGLLYGPDQEAGAVLESDKPLDKLFANKFVRLGMKKSKGVSAPEDDQEFVDVSPAGSMGRSKAHAAATAAQKAAIRGTQEEEEDDEEESDLFESVPEGGEEEEDEEKPRKKKAKKSKKSKE